MDARTVNPTLTPRLALIARMTPPCSLLVDVGTDHALLPVALTLSGKAAHAYASDLREGPLLRAAETIRRYRADRVKTIRSDGLDAPELWKADAVVIAGMGGELISGIMGRAAFLRETRPALVLQPQTRDAGLRRWLCGQGYDIQDEGAVVDNGFPYAVLRAAYTGQTKECTPLFAELGLLIEDTSAASVAYKSKRLSLLQKKKNGLAGSGRHPETERALETLIRGIEEVLA